MYESIIIADDHPLILKGLQDFLTERNYNVVASARDGKEALDLIRDLKPEIAILDIQMPHYTGLEIVKICEDEKSTTKIILITIEKDEELYKQCKEQNIYGYVLKELALAEIENCLASVREGKPYFSPELTAHLDVEAIPENLFKLTPTEIKVLKHIAQNKIAKEIADTMFVSTRTIEKHKSNLIHKLQLESKPNSLIIFAKDNQQFFDKIT